MGAVSLHIFVFKCHLVEEVIAKSLLLENIKPSTPEGSQTVFWSSGKSGCEFSWLIFLCRMA